jgi:acetyltransferase-like isoleucine patch superfamily enzyme
MNESADDDITRMNEAESMEIYGYSGRIGRLKFKAKFLRSWLLQSIAYFSPHPGLAIQMHRARGVEIGKNCYIGPYVQIDLLYPHLIKIGDNVTIGTSTMIFSHSVATTNLLLKRHGYGRKLEPVIIKSGAIIYPGSIIKSGVIIGENSMISIGSVVTENVPDYCIAMGNPARIVRKIG